MKELDALFNQAVQLYQGGRIREAEALCLDILENHPGHAHSLHLLGGIAHLHGQDRRAAELINQAITIMPDNPLYYFNLGIAYKAQNRLEQARAVFEQVLALKPDYAEAWNELGLISYQLGDREQASEKYQKALNLKPGLAAAWNNMGNIIKDQGRLQEAISYFQNALRLDPAYAEAHNNLGNMLDDTGQKEEALKHLREACRLKPDLAEAHSNLLFLLSYNVLCSPRQMLDESRQWDRDHGASNRFEHVTSGEMPQRLRIGYVSPDLKRHAVSYFLEPILPDDVTRRLQGLAHHWRSTVGLDDETVARQIHDDGIHVLVDLAGHTAHNRLRVFSFKPAPVQVTYLGYCATTGLQAMDYWITDTALHPPDTTELATEALYRLPRCWLAYRPDPQAPPVSSRPDGPVVFGCFNDLSKITSQVIALWCEILHAVPGSRLVLKTRALADPRTRARLCTQFSRHDIGEERLALLPATRDYLAAYHEIDIALDPFPRTGGATTADALWMGVPVVSLAGQRYIERQGLSMLSALELTDLVASSSPEYRDKAIALARDYPRRAQLRDTLRQRMARSPLCDHTGLARALERAFRVMWAQSTGDRHSRS